MRAKIGWVVTLLGVLVALLGLAIMIYLGPDGRRATEPHVITTDGIAIVTTPKVLGWAGVELGVRAEVPANKPVFIGIANAVDVDSYVAKTTRIEVTSFHMPWQLKSRTIKASNNLPASPIALDWWLAENAGLGGATISTTLPNETVRLAILSVGASNLGGLKVTVAYGLKGGFAKGAGLLLLGIGGVWLGLLMRRGADLLRDRGFEDDDDDDEMEFEEIEEIVYVYVDDDGVEHEVSADEAEQLGLAIDDELELEPEPEPEPEPVAKPASSSKPPVTYIFIDEDGVEHEVGEDELADYEIIDEEDER